MTRFLAVLLAALALAPACGGEQERPSSKTGTETEAAIRFKRPVALNLVLEMAHRRDVRPTQLITRTPLVGETITAAVAFTRSRRGLGEDLDLDLIERQAIERALARCNGNISHAAAALGLTRPALYRRMAKHGL